uniref:NADH-ubiquinone oxidoreductase chain 3 n=1 Tax=Crangonyx forbesi TaxID=111557 RepID=A0A6C0X582_9CRUS|nr:NADH dehydrogenase subunit 3 [Crangonyx forbesi]
MHLVSVLLVVLTLISTVVLSLAALMSKTMNKSRDTYSSFECGFDSYKKSRLPFSLRFFLVTVMFLIFDAEIALITPLALQMVGPSPDLILLTALIIMVILILGLYYEWKAGMLLWI